MEIETYSREAGEQKMMHSVMYVQVWGKMIYIDKNRDQPYSLVVEHMVVVVEVVGLKPQSP